MTSMNIEAIGSSADSKNNKLKILIAGGGAGGLELAVGLARRYKQEFEVVLIDKEKTHLWKPHLHEVASGTLDSHYEQVDYLSLASKFKFRFVWGEFVSVNRNAQTVELKERQNDKGEVVVPQQTLSYDKLVLAIGSTSNDFKTPGVRQFSFSLDDLESANNFQSTLLEKTIQKEYENATTRTQENFTISVVGGGATGVELSAELFQTTKKLSQFGLEQLKNKPLKLNLVNAAPQLLPGMSDKISNGAAQILNDLNVNVMNSTKVVAIEKGVVVVEKDGSVERMQSDMIVWAAGVKSSDILRNIEGLEFTLGNQIKVSGTLQPAQDKNIFVIGDCAAVAWLQAPKAGMNVPPRAQSAHQMSDYLIKNIQKIIQGKTVAPFNYQDFGSLVSLGDHDSVGTLMGFLSSRSLFVEGRIAKFMYLSLYNGHQVKIHGFVAAMGLLLGKLIQKRFKPQVKLH